MGRFVMRSSLNVLQGRLLSRWLMVLLVLTVGCSSTVLRSRRLAPEAEPGKEFGIIYQMTKPQFTITISQPSDTSAAPKYTLNVEFVPDPERRFAVYADPGIFKESDLTVNLNTNGAMTGLTEASREQVTPTIKAISDFTTSIIGASATVAGVMMLDDKTDNQVAELTRRELAKRLEIYTEKQDTTEAAPKTDLSRSTPDLDALSPGWSRLSPTEQDAQKPALNQRLWDAAKRIKGRLNALPNVRNYKITDLAAALKPEIQTAQVSVLKALAKPVEKQQEEAKGKFDAQLKLLENSFPFPSQAAQPSDNAARERIIEESELARERALVVGEVRFAVKNEDLLTLLGYSERELAETSRGSQTTTISPDKQKKELRNQARDLATLARDVVLSTTTFPNLLGPLIKTKTPAQQIYQQVKEVQGKIVEQQALLVSEPDPAKRKAYQDKINDLTRAFHETIGAADEYVEILKLQKMNCRRS